MMEFILNFFDHIRWQDIIDISLLFFIFYRIIILIQGTRTVQMVSGFILFLALYYSAEKFELLGLSLFLDNFFSFFVIIVIVLFQADIRTGLAQIGKNRWLNYAGNKRNISKPLQDELEQACLHLSRERIGALIVIEKTIGLKNYIQTGEKLNAKFSLRLLVSIFSKFSPLHDGALFINKEGQIEAAGCILPLTSRMDITQQYGTRHRAAIGMSEETDADIIVISEETGMISFVKEQKVIVPLREHFRENLSSLLQ